ncbi:uncharacterized protein [Aegilops tauschii subsp. strangulata]|nr:disease resistance protein RGA5-like [Aegilops tauschii subsp. strangulata]
MEDLDAASSLPAMADPDPVLLQVAMQDPITAWLGPVGPLLRKLHLAHSLPPDLLRDDDDIRRLKDLCMCLKIMSEDQDANCMVQWWMKMARELCYDTDDLLDEFSGIGLHLHFPARAKGELSGLLARVKDACERRQRFQLSSPKAGGAEAGASGLTVPISGCSTVSHVELPEQLVELLALDDDQKTLKVIPITGCAGVGKTTVARALYHRHGWKFQCRAFVTVSRNPHMRGFLTSMLSQLKAPWLNGFPDVPDLIHAISKHLRGKRYFIVIDDLWTASVWNIISRAFPRGDSCSRIITTTQIDDVALACCGYYPVHIYKMEPLNDYKYLELFFGIKEVPNIQKEKWLREDKEYFEQMKDVLNLIYSSLPPRLKTCLLYLSMYAHGYVIKKDELLKLWVAEGFLSAVGEQGPEEIAQRYFDELVSRGMVQAVDTTYHGEVLSCSVHQIVLDFIRHKSREENFIITIDYDQSTLALPEKVRRLSAQFGGVKSAYIPESIVTSNVRSLIFWGFFKCLSSSFVDYRFLRILILHIWADEDNESLDLTGIGELFLLKYLEIECNNTIKLPGTDMIRWLQPLETLKVHAKVVAFPSDIVLLDRLLHLRLLSEYIQHSVVAHMTSLRTLGYFDIGSHSEENILHLGRLKNLQDLQLTCTTVQPAENLERNVQLLGSILAELTVLQSLTLVPSASGSSCVNIPEDGFNMVTPPPDLLLRTIELSRHCCIFFTLPKWFGELRKLCIIKIAIRELSGEDIDILKKLSALTALTLYIQKPPAGRILMDNEGFQVLAYFKFMCAEPCMFFAEGAVPKVQKLKLGFNLNKMEPHAIEIVGFHHLIGLREVCIKFGVQDAEEFNINDAESELEAAIRNHPNTPVIRVQRVDVISYTKEGQSTATEEIEGKLQEIQEGKKQITEHLEEQEENLQKIHIDKKIIHVEEENRLEINVDKKRISEIWEIQDKNKLEIQEDKKQTRNRPPTQVESRHARTDRVSSPLKHHAQSLVFAIGAMGSLLLKLGEVIKDEYKLQKGVQKKVKSFSAELDVMRAALGKVADVPWDQLDEQVNLWAADVRELSYYMEDVVDSFLMRVEGCGSDANQARFKKLMANMANQFKKGKARHEISTAINEIHKRLQDVTRRHERYNLANLPAATRTTVDPFLEVLYGDKKNIIGLDKARDDIIKKITEGDLVSKAQLKILSIVGFGGLGKTTLAREVYETLPTKFDYKAFVSVSRNQDMHKVLSNLLFKLDKKRHASLNAANLDVEQLIIVVRELLSKKRYFIIIDDLWNKVAWTTIRYALIDGGCGSIIITTTRLLDVSEICCSSKDDMIHQMKPLSYHDSHKLFYGRIFSSEVCPSGFEQVSREILKKCAGVPLAIISLASYLANNQRANQIDQWYVLLNSIGHGLQNGDDHVKKMKRILSLSYYDLSPYLKTCLLYLSIFPEDHQISRDELISIWICGGFIQVKDETASLLELGESYFNELVNRNMIMPINIHADGRVEACCVHDIMLDLIFELASGENFVTILDVIKGGTPLAKKFCRLDIQKSMTDLTNAQMATTSMTKVRSFSIFSPAITKRIPPLSIFQFLGVLDLEGCDLQGVDLRHVENLLLLRHLGLRGTKVGNLPKEIGKLQLLQTLDLHWTNSTELPSSVFQLGNLMCLILDSNMQLPKGFCNLTCLEQLKGDGVGHFSADSAEELGRLDRLR